MFEDFSVCRKYAKILDQRSDSMKKSSLQVLFCVAVFTLCVNAETLVMGKAGSGEGPHSFHTATDWIREDGTTINAAPVAGNDYIVADNYVMNVNGTRTFAGDSLQFGYVGGSKGVFFHTNPGNTVTVGRLILANGLYRVWQNKDNSSMSYLTGNIEVLSPASAPFRICPTHDSANSPSGYEITWASAISGAAGTGLLINRIAPEKYARLVFSGDNSKYRGNITVEGTNLVFEAAKASSLGSTLGTFNAEALVLDKQATFECSAASETLSLSANRGIAVKTYGAKINVAAGKRLCVEWPIDLQGNLEKVGSGTLVLDSVPTGPGKIIVSSGSVAVLPGKIKAVDSLFFNGGAIEVLRDVESGASGVLELSAAPESEIKVTPPTQRGVTVPFLRIPASAGILDVSRFVPVENLAQLGLPSFTISIKEENGYSVAYLTTAMKVMPVPGNKIVYALQNPELWDNGKIFQPCCDYVIDVKSAGRQQQFSVGDLGSVDDEVLDYTMPLGSSITFTGQDIKNAPTNAIWLIRQRTFTGDVRAVGDRVLFRAMGHSKPTEPGKYPADCTGDVHVIKGRLLIDNVKGNDEGFKIQAGYSQTVKIESAVSGKGTVSLQTWGENNTARSAIYELSGTNSYAGEWFIYNGYAHAKSLLTFRFGDAKNFGPGGYTHDDILFQGGNLLVHPVGSVAINLPNRDIVFYSGSIELRIDDGNELGFDSGMTFRNGSGDKPTILTKTGGGIWSIGGTVNLKVNTAVTYGYELNVNEGYIRADNARAFSGMTVTFADGAGIAAKYDPGSALESAQYGMIVTNAALFAVSGAKLPVKIDTNGDSFFNKRLPVLTVPAGAADSIGAKLKGITDIPMGSVSFVRDSVALGDKDYVRFSAEIHRGTVIMFR